MTTSVSSLTIGPVPINNTPANDSLPKDVLFPIFKMLGFNDWLSLRATCRTWKAHIDDSDCGRYIQAVVQEIGPIENLCQKKPKCSGWKDVPRHWSKYQCYSDLKLTSCSGDFIAVQPSKCYNHFFPNAARFFSFISPIPFLFTYSVLAQCGSTYFLTEIKDKKLSRFGEPPVKKKLITYNFKDPSKNREVDFPDSEIEYCFPLSESKVAVVTRQREDLFVFEVSLWNLSSKTPVAACRQTFQRQFFDVHRIGNYLISYNQIIDLTTLAIRKHDLFLDHYPKIIKTCNSGLCGLHKDELSYFSMSSSGEFELKWTQFVLPEQSKSTFLLDMNEKYIVVLVKKNNHGFPFQIFDSKSGEEIVHDIPTTYHCPIAQLSGNVLTYWHPGEQAIHFWHIPSNERIKRLDCRKLIFSSAKIEDMRFYDGKLTLLFRNGSKMCLIQFDPQYTPQRENCDIQ